MNNAPTVYVPTQPEGDGLTLPTLLSLLAHGIVLGVLIYTYQTPEIEIAGSIETTMVTPGELAQMQGQILANRAAAAEQAASASSSAAAQMQVNESDSDATDQNSAQSSSQQVPVFTRSDEPSSSRSMLMSEIQQQRLLEQTQEYERNMAELAAELDGTQALEEFQQKQTDERMKDNERLKNYQAKGAKRVKTDRPNSKQPRVTNDSNGLGITSGTNPIASSPLNLATDGEKNGFDSTKNPSEGSPTRSTGSFKSGILNAIKSALNTPTNTQGLTTSLSLRLDNRGNVKYAKARGSNDIVNKAVEEAARAASPLPIDLDNPTSFASLTINVTID